MNGIKKIISIGVIICLIISQTACGNMAAAETTSFSEDWLMNTYCYIETFEGGQEEILNNAFALARSYERKLSRTIETSQVATGDFDEETQALVDEALSFEEASGGLFCIHLGAVSDAWDFSGTKGGSYVPSEDAIKAGLEEQVLDLGAIAKGYIADKTAEYLREEGVTSAILSFGGNIYCLGEKPSGGRWQIDIEKPFSGSGEKLNNRETSGYVLIDGNMSVVTSGIYERCFTAEDGTFYHHILNAQTGYPCSSDLVSASITGERSEICDALATISILMGSEKAADFVSSYGYGYVFITTEGKILTGGVDFTPVK